MIISQTPLRISFVGGGTDLPAFYRRHTGRVLSTAIDKYIYVIVKERYDDFIVLNYSSKEKVREVDAIRHELLRECVRRTGIRKGIEITTIADIPSRGSGLGSSSSLTVGALNALYAYRGIQKSLQELAAEACDIEIDALSHPIGLQDQYAAAFGGLRLYEFTADAPVRSEYLDLDLGDILDLQSHFYLVYTGLTRQAADILSEQNQRTDDNADTLAQMARMPLEVKSLLEDKQFAEFGQYLDRAWRLKKQLAGGISNPQIDEIYQFGLQCGAIGGKLLGAGGGGFVLFCVPDGSRGSFVRQMKNQYKLLPFAFERCGTRIILNSGRNQHMV